MERKEGQQLDAKALEMLSQLREQSRLVQELRENEAKSVLGLTLGGLVWWEL